VEGIDSEEDIQRKKAEREARLKVQQEKARALKEQRKQEEREKWWDGATIFRPRDENDSNSGNSAAKQLTNEEMEKKTQLLNRYTADYSRWNDWTPNDEATLEEIAQINREQEDARNKEFEKNNPEFCNQYLGDMEKRKKATEQKQESADIARLKGNRYFKAKTYDRALEYYMDSLKQSPFDAKTVNNIAQVYIKTKEYDDALEFLARTLYLEPNNIKALSRKTTVLGEQGHIAEAMDTVAQALAVEPTNTDLLAQQKELVCIERERQEEAAAMVALSNSGVSPGNNDASTASSSSSGASASTATTSAVSSTPALPSLASTSPPTELVDSLNLIAKDMLLLATKSADPTAAVWTTEKLAELVLTTEKILHATDGGSREAGRSNDLPSTLRVYVRTSETLARLVELARVLCSPLTDDAAASDASDYHGNVVKALESVIRFITIAADQQRASKLCVLDGKLLPSLKVWLKDGYPMRSLSLLDAVFALFRMCSIDDILVKAKTAVITDKTLLYHIATVLGNVSYKISKEYGTISTSSSGKSSFAMSSTELSILSTGAGIVKDCAFHEHGQATLANIDAILGASLVCGIASALAVVSRSFSTIKRGGTCSGGVEVTIEASLNALEVLIEAATGLSQIKCLREHFAIEVPLVEKDEPAAAATGSAVSANSPLTLAGAVVDTIRAVPFLTVNGIASLMNACLEPSNAVRQAILNRDGLDLVLPEVRFSEEQRAAYDDKVTLVRKAGLLARLAGDASVQQQLMKPENYRPICQRIAIAPPPPPSAPTAAAAVVMAEKWLLDERGHYARILANITKPSPECLAIGMEQGILASLLQIFPTPREEMGEVTALSVTLMPADMPSPLLLGNAARCLMPYADCTTSYAKELYTNASLKAVEKLICAMASCPDIHVRRNMAILLAKGSRLPGVREKLTELRGMQMMIELQDKL